MTIEQAVMENLKILPLSKKEEVLEFTEFLTARERNTTPRAIDAVEHELATLNENELIHLEMEFEDYDKLYPLQ